MPCARRAVASTGWAAHPSRRVSRGRWCGLFGRRPHLKWPFLAVKRFLSGAFGRLCAREFATFAGCDVIVTSSSVLCSGVRHVGWVGHCRGEFERAVTWSSPRSSAGALPWRVRASGAPGGVAFTLGRALWLVHVSSLRHLSHPTSGSRRAVAARRGARSPELPRGPANPGVPVDRARVLIGRGPWIRASLVVGRGRR